MVYETLFLCSEYGLNSVSKVLLYSMLWEGGGTDLKPMLYYGIPPNEIGY